MHRTTSWIDRSDRELKQRVMNFLTQRFSRADSIEVEAEHGVVTIRGSVSSFYQRQLFINCCQRVAGVVQLNDELQVADSKRFAPQPQWKARTAVTY